MSHAPRWQRRARPLLGTLVEVGLDAAGAAGEAADTIAAKPSEAAFAENAFATNAFSAAFAAVAAVQACLSRFEAGSDVGRFNAAAAGLALDVEADTAAVLQLAQQLFDDTGGAFDVALGSGRWSLRGRQLTKHDAATRIDLGGIGKGHAVDRAVAALRAAGVARGWVNAGGDLRVFGDAAVPLKLRDEHSGGVADCGLLRDGAFATSRFDAPGHARLTRGPASAALATSAAPSRPGASQPHRRSANASCHVSVAAPSCVLADALTKVVALSGDATHPLLARHGARAWLHRRSLRQAA